VVALTKSDLGRADIVAEEIRRRLRGTRFADSPIVPTSVRIDTGIKDLERTLAAELAAAEPKQDIGKPRLFIDRVFTLRGIGTIVTGTLSDGSLRRGQQIMVYPANLETRIRSIQSHRQELQIAQPGMRTAINLPDVPVDQVKRGDVITIRDLGAPGATPIVVLEKSARLHREDHAARPIKNGTSIYLHHGTSRVPARIALCENGSLEPGQKKVARLRLVSPILAFIGDRFVIRDSSEQYTIGGGMVVDADGDKKSFTSSTAWDLVDSFVRVTIARHGFAPRENLLTKSRFSADEISEALLRLQRDNEIILRQHIAADREFWRSLLAQAVGLIDKAHRQRPDRAGVDLNDLRSALRIPQSEILEALLADLCDADFIRKGSMVARASHRPALPDELQVAEKRIRDSLSKNPFDPPPRKTIESDPQAQQVVRFLLENSELIEIAPDVLLLRENFERMKKMAAEFIKKNGPATVSQLRQALESSRRIVVPFLERLDREAFTRRVGDKRSLRSNR
jgi:selenocysteine-specific elongation factor